MFTQCAAVQRVVQESPFLDPRPHLSHWSVLERDTKSLTARRTLGALLPFDLFVVTGGIRIDFSKVSKPNWQRGSNSRNANKELFGTYWILLLTWRGHLSFMPHSPETVSSRHLLTFMWKPEEREKFLAASRSKKWTMSPHYCSLDRSPVWVWAWPLSVSVAPNGTWVEFWRIQWRTHHLSCIVALCSNAGSIADSRWRREPTTASVAEHFVFLSRISHTLLSLTLKRQAKKRSCPS